MTAAFRLNLSALSMLALVVGLFLIYNTMTFSVVRRRQLFGTLRCLGVTRGEVFRMVLSEALVVGVTGSLLGLGLGILMGRQTVGMVVQTINDLYFTTTVQAVGIPPISLLKGALLGVLTTLITAALPALEAASVPPRLALSRSGLEGKTQRVVLWLAAAGVVTIGLGVWLLNLPGQGLVSGFGGTLAVVFGSAMLSAFALLGLMRLAGPLLGKAFGFLGRLAAGNLVNALSRTSVAVAALMVAVSVSIGVSLMITSFRHTVQLWLHVTLQGDVYVSAPAFTGTTPSVPIDPQAVEIVRRWPGVQRVELLRSTNVNSTQGMLRLTAVTNQNIAYERLFMHMWAPPEELWRRMQAGAVIVTEPLARRLNLLEPGKSLTLSTQDGWKDFAVVGVYYDYASSDGSILMATPLYTANWQDSSVTAIDLRLVPGTDADALAASLSEALNPFQRLLVRPNQTLRDDILAVFDRTFAITAALRVLATVVAFAGILNTLLLLQLEKQRETGILRALGLSRSQLWRLVMMETGLMGLVAGVLAMPTGYALALILIYVINQRSFGWTLQPDIPAWVFLQALLVALAAALLSGIIPAFRLSRIPAAEAIRYE
jgi:putative ABC transport system permease protein